MAGEWHEVKIGELANVFDGPHATPPKTESGPVFLGISNLVNGRVDLSDTQRLSEADYVRWTRRVTPMAGDLVFSYETRLGEAALIPDGLCCCLGRRMGLLRVRPGKVDQRFFLYAYLGPQFQETLRSRTVHGSTVDRIPLIDLPEFPIRIPADIREQRAIAHILGALDDKIELNRRMNETLEAIARAIFKSWFVDFDPVRAKAKARDTGLPPHIADLFPDSFEDSELGEIPSGWRVGRVREIGDVVCGKTPPTKVAEYYGEDVPFITIPDMHDKVFAVTTNKMLSNKGADYQRNKTLPAGAICVSCIATVGLIVITTSKSQTNQQINTVIPQHEDEAYFWYWTLRDLGEEIKAGGSGGSVLTNLSTGRFSELMVVTPARELRVLYSEYVARSFERILRNVRESLTLSDLRDALLPKLISGELRVADAKRSLEAAI
ncbi:MAG: restriction endonuclease subunit S [Nitrolancea sp.]